MSKLEFENQILSEIKDADLLSINLAGLNPRMYKNSPGLRGMLLVGSIRAMAFSVTGLAIFAPLALFRGYCF